MHPVLFDMGSLTIYTYGACIALGAILGFSYMVWQGKKHYGFTFDQANTLFILLVAASVIGGKFFLIFENPSLYLKQPGKLLSGSGFVFYGSLLFAIPTMLWFFRKHRLPWRGMLDIMAVVTCVVHLCGRIGCFMAGCCYGKPTAHAFGVTFTNPQCQARPLGESLHPTQLYEAGLIAAILVFLWIWRERKSFDGQLFLMYLLAYAAGRGVLEIFRGDVQRGFVIRDILSHSQLISLLVMAAAIVTYAKWKRSGTLGPQKKR
ncbi:MAG: prolipoprotein diacylglyceryl transferase [Cyclobacteriaceae bacterium]|jgi:phosphatidylglycerol:prolipoprotein diacylglycerol transferase|nr:prolipoprotein diacylglyceryl transferase [Cyclobacteriaceae bacterium]